MPPAVIRATAKSSVDKNHELGYCSLTRSFRENAGFSSPLSGKWEALPATSDKKTQNMLFFPKKVSSRREVLWLTVQVGAYALLSALAVTTLLMKIIGREVPDIYLYAVAVPLIIAPPIAYWLANLIYEVTRLGDEIERIAYVDDLTGIANRRAFFERVPFLIEQSKDPEANISIILIDIDNFKRINDTYGHKAGDAMLVAVADILTEAMRDANGIVGRIGGEEFALLVVRKNMSDAIDLADQIRLNIKSAAIETQNAFISATVSIGLAHHSPEDDLDNTLLRADKALYLAKNAGRDRVMGLMADAASTCLK